MFDSDIADAKGAHDTLSSFVRYCRATLGVPCVAVPAGMAGGMPAGVQVIGARYRPPMSGHRTDEAVRGLATPIDPLS